MRSLKRIVAMVLAAGMLVTSSGVTTLAAGDAAATQSEVSSNTPDVNGGESGQAVEVPEIENMGEISGTTVSATGETTEGTAGEQQENVNSNSEIMENPKAFEYVYVDEQTVNIPQEQNIAVAFADAELKLESAVLHYNRVEDGMTYDMLAANLVNNTVLFTMGYSDASEAGQYQLEGITYRVIGQEEDFYVNFSEQEVTAGYKVTTEPEQETVEESEISEIGSDGILYGW